MALAFVLPGECCLWWRLGSKPTSASTEPLLNRRKRGLRQYPVRVHPRRTTTNNTQKVPGSLPPA